MNRKLLFRLACCSLFLTAVLFLLTLCYAPSLAVLTLLLSLLWNLCFALVLYYYDRHVRMLSQNLMHIYVNGAPIVMRKQQEGALSILENDIYKLVRTCYEQRERSLKDRAFLADMLSDISHQLKTPLTSMQMMGELLAQPLPLAKRAEFSDILLRQLERLEWLVSSLLKLSKLDACAITFQPQDIPIQALLAQACAPIASLVEQKQLHIQLPQTKLTLATDVKWTKEALLNILKNAAEHTPQGGSIRIEAWESALFVTLRITDSGEGMSRKDQAHIFERFYRGENAAADSIGIGMAMAKAILEAQHADIQVQSALGKGTAFTIQFSKETH